MRILVTGGAGFVGSHAVVELARAGHEPVIVDLLTNSSERVLKNIEVVTGRQFSLYKYDCTDADLLRHVFAQEPIDAVMHFAGLKAVGESVREPLRYYRNNLDSALSLTEAMAASGVRRLVFSSSCTVYGEPESLPLREDARVGDNLPNPYGWTKLMQEQIFRDVVVADARWSVSVLRYFNPVGAHESGMLGEDPAGVPANVLPLLAKVAAGELERLQVYGNDYPTADGTGVRDYIHVVDLARGHLAALDHLAAGETQVFNLGTGRGTSVLELIQIFERVSGRAIPYDFASRRPGDVAAAYADPTKAARELGWKAERTVEDACRDLWRWKQRNPRGYATASTTRAPGT
ncbi:MAG: UDP-glucose 4-epimerase GalE [Chloroflexi bacterium]|nr:MAG: UDP-glucose 4-epimerase GalE [Chloroflexota bacterium]